MPNARVNPDGSKAHGTSWSKRFVALAVALFFAVSAVSFSFVPSVSAASPGSSADRGKEKLTGEALNGTTIEVRNPGSVTAIVTAYVKKAGGEMNYHNIEDVTLIPGETAEITVNGLADGIGVVSKRGFIYPIDTTTVITGQTEPGAPVTASGSPVLDKTYADEKGHFKLVIPASAMKGNKHEFHIIAGDAVEPGRFGPNDKNQGWMGFKENRVIKTVKVGATKDVGKISLEFDPLEVDYTLSSAVADFSERIKPPVRKTVKKSGKKIHRTIRRRNVKFQGWKSKGKVKISFERIHNFPKNEKVSLGVNDYSDLESVEIASHSGLSAVEKGCEKGSFSISAVPKSPGVAGSLEASVRAGGKKVFNLSKEIKGGRSPEEWKEWLDIGLEKEKARFKAPKVLKKRWSKTNAKNVGGKYKFTKVKFERYGPGNYGSKKIPIEISSGGKNRKFKGKVKLSITSVDPSLNAELTDNEVYVGKGEEVNTALRISPDNPKKGGKSKKAVTIMAEEANPGSSEPLSAEIGVVVNLKAASKEVKKELVNQWKEWFDLDTSGHRFEGSWNKSVSGHRVETKRKNGKYYKKKLEKYTYSLKDWQTASIPVTIKGHNFDGKVNLDIKADPGLKASLRDSSLDVHSKTSTVMNVTPSNALLSEDWESGTDGWLNHGGNIIGRSHSDSKSLELRGREEISREIDLSGCNGVTISYWEKGWSFDGPANRCEQARLDFYDGSNWHNKLKDEKRNRFGWEKETYDIPDSWLSSNNKIRFKFEDHGCDGCCGGDHWVIDDIKVTGNGSSRANTTSLKHVKVYARDANPPGRTTLLTEGWEDGNANGWNKDFNRRSRGGEDHNSGVSRKADSHSGSYVMYIHNANRIQKTIDLTDVPASKTVKVTWWWKARSCEGGDGVNFLVNGNEVKTEHKRNTGWRKESYNLSSYAGKQVTIGFEGEVGPWDYLSVDDLKVTYGVEAISRKKLADVTIIIPPKGPKSKKIKEWQEWFDLNTSGHKFTGKWDNTIENYEESTSLTDSGTKYLKKRYAKYSYALQNWEEESLPVSIKGHNFDGKVKLGVSVDPGITASLEKTTLDVHSTVSTNLNVKPTIRPSKADTRIRDVKVYAWDANPPENTSALRKDVVADITVVVPSHGPKKKLVDQWKEWFELDAPDKIQAWNKWTTTSYSVTNKESEEKTQTKKFPFENYKGCSNGDFCDKAYEAAEQWAKKGDMNVTTKIKLTGYVESYGKRNHYKHKLENTPMYINLPSSDYEPEVNPIKKQGKVVSWLGRKSKNYETKDAALKKYQSLAEANISSPIEKYKNLKMENQTDYSEPIEWGAMWWEKKWHFKNYSDKSKAKDKLKAVKNSESGPYGYGTEYYGEKMYPDNYKAKWYTLNSHSKTYDTKKQAESAKAYRGRYNGEIEKVVGNREYKAEWTVTEPHYKWYDTKSEAKKHGKVVNTRRDLVDTDYKVRWTTSKTHKQWFDHRSDHSGTVLAKKCTNHETYYTTERKCHREYVGWKRKCHREYVGWKRKCHREYVGWKRKCHREYVGWKRSCHWERSCHWKRSCHRSCSWNHWYCRYSFLRRYYSCHRSCHYSCSRHRVCNRHRVCHRHYVGYKRKCHREYVGWKRKCHREYVGWKRKCHREYVGWKRKCHQERVRHTRCTDYDYKIRWTTTQTHTARIESRWNARQHRGSIVDTYYQYDTDYKAKWITTEHKSKWYDSYSDALAKDESGHVESRVSDYDYRLTWDTKSYSSDTFISKSDAKDAATKGDRHKVFVKPIHWQVEYYEKNWKSKEGFKSESAAKGAYQNNTLRHGGSTYVSAYGVDWTVSWDAPREKKYANPRDAWSKYRILNSKEGIKNLKIKDEKFSVGYKAKRYGIVTKRKKTTYTDSWKKAWYRRSSPTVRLSVTPRGTGDHKFNGDVKLSVVDASDGNLVATLNDVRVSANGQDESALSFGGKTYSYHGYAYEVGPKSGDQWVKIKAKDADGSLTRTRKVKLDIGTKGTERHGKSTTTTYDFEATGAPKFTVRTTKNRVEYGPKKMFKLFPAGIEIKGSLPKAIIRRGDAKKVIWVEPLKGDSPWSELFPKRMIYIVHLKFKSMQTGRTQTADILFVPESMHFAIA